MHLVHHKPTLLPVSNMAQSLVEPKDYDGSTVSRVNPVPGVRSQTFAGRLGGNQQFVVSSTDPSYQELVAKEPDASRESTWKALLDLRGFYESDLYRLAAIEGIGTMLQTFLGGLLGVGLTPSATETSVGAIFPVTYAGIVQIILITIFIFAAGAITGAQFNPLITMGTFFTKLSSLPRTILYITFQCMGAVIGAFLLRASLGASPEDLKVVPGCYVDTSLVTAGEAYVIPTANQRSCHK